MELHAIFHWCAVRSWAFSLFVCCKVLFIMHEWDWWLRWRQPYITKQTNKQKTATKIHLTLTNYMSFNIHNNVFDTHIEQIRIASMQSSWTEHASPDAINSQGNSKRKMTIFDKREPNMEKERKKSESGDSWDAIQNQFSISCVSHFSNGQYTLCTHFSFDD